MRSRPETSKPRPRLFEKTNTKTTVFGVKAKTVVLKLHLNEMQFLVWLRKESNTLTVVGKKVSCGQKVGLVFTVTTVQR